MTMLLSLSADYCHTQKKSFKPKPCIPFRSHSDEQINPNSNHRRSHSVDLFTLVIPKNNDSSFSSLLCPICSLPMMKPTLLPCQHTFCLRCIQNAQQIRPGSLPIHSHNCLLSNDHQTKTITCQKCSRIHRINSLADLEENRSVELLINTLLCETCQQLHPSNQLDTCLHCFGVLCSNCYEDHVQNHQNDLITNPNLYRITSNDETVNISIESKSIENNQSSDSQIFKARSFNTEKKPLIESTKQMLAIESNENENIDPSEINSTKKKSNNIFHKLINSSRHRQLSSVSMKDTTAKTPSSPVKKISSVKLHRRPKIKIDTKIEETSAIEPIPTSVPVTPVRRFMNLFDQYSYTVQHVKQCTQRKSELNRAVQKLIEVLTIKTNENINQISQYWMHLKQLLIEQFQSKTDRFQLFNYLLRSCCSSLDSRKQIELYFQRNDEIQAALQVLSTTLTIVNDQQTSLSLSLLFDREEQTTIRTLRRQFESLLSSYADELSFITERINVYESRFSAWKNSNTMDLDSITNEWTQIVEHDYPSLVEKVSNDFITKIPQIEKILTHMLKNMKKRLLTTDHQTTSLSTSIC